MLARALRPHRRFIAALLAGFLLLPAGRVAAQQWNSPAVDVLVRRAIARRQERLADSSLTSYQALAHGFVFFLAQVGEGLTQPPRLVKADELDVQVYWRAPGRSKQVILGWRDGSWLPTDIDYHRDHLGIVTNNFGNTIRMGEGDEVRDAIHPLSPAGPDHYDYALGDSTRIQTGDRTVTVVAVQVRPRSFRQALVVGTMYLDVGTAELVRFRFSFTPASYLDSQLEDISIVLENSLWEDRYWLPYRQEVEIRRRSSWMDFPARGIIRGRWEIRHYRFNVSLPPALFAGPAIGGLRAPAPNDTLWHEPLARAVAGVAAPVNQQDMQSLRLEVEKLAGAHALSGLRRTRLAAHSLSDLVHVNRVQGLTLGFGGFAGLERRRLRIRPFASYGISDHRLLGSLALEADLGGTSIALEGARRIRDFSAWPVIAPALNSFSAQEFGRDYGDYVFLESASLALHHRLTGRTALTATAFTERSNSVAVAATPATGRYRPNSALGAGTYSGGRLRLERSSGGIAVTSDLQGALAVEAADGPTGYLRAAGELRWIAPVPGGQLLVQGRAGWGSAGLPAYRSFVLGGRSTLPGEPYRAWGGRSMLWGHVEWQLQAPFPAIPLGSFASTGTTITVAPFIAAGWTDRGIPGTPWPASPGVRPVGGVALEWFMRLLRVEAGVGLLDGRVGVSAGIQRDWWDIL